MVKGYVDEYRDGKKKRPLLRYTGGRRMRMDKSMKLLIVQTMLEMKLVDTEGKKGRMPNNKIKELAEKTVQGNVGSLQTVISKWNRSGELKQLVEEIIAKGGFREIKKRVSWSKLDEEIANSVKKLDKKGKSRKETYRILGDKFGTSPSSIRVRISKLMKRGLVKRKMSPPQKKEPEEKEGGGNLTEFAVSLLKGYKLKIEIQLEEK